MTLPELNSLPRDSCRLKMRRRKKKGKKKKQGKYIYLPNDHDNSKIYINASNPTQTIFSSEAQKEMKCMSGT